MRSDGKPVNPRHAPVRERMLEAFRRRKGADYPWAFGREDKLLADLLARVPDDDALVGALDRALIEPDPFHRPDTLADFSRRLPRWLGTVPAAPGKQRVAAEASAKTMPSTGVVRL